jgi:hypothetical protein
MYASAVIANPTEPPPIVALLRRFCWCILGLLCVVVFLAFVCLRQAGAPWTTWLLVTAFAMTIVIFFVLALQMRH